MAEQAVVLGLKSTIIPLAQELVLHRTCLRFALSIFPIRHHGRLR